jgi:hypothetical protein
LMQSRKYFSMRTNTPLTTSRNSSSCGAISRDVFTTRQPLCWASLSRSVTVASKKSLIARFGGALPPNAFSHLSIDHCAIRVDVSHGIELCLCQNPLGRRCSTCVISGVAVCRSGSRHPAIGDSIGRQVGKCLSTARDGGVVVGYLFLAPLFTILLAHFVLGSVLTSPQAIGGFLIGLSIWLVNRGLLVRSQQEESGELPTGG